MQKKKKEGKKKTARLIISPEIKETLREEDPSQKNMLLLLLYQLILSAHAAVVPPDQILNTRYTTVDSLPSSLPLPIRRNSADLAAQPRQGNNMLTNHALGKKSESVTVLAQKKVEKVHLPKSIVVLNGSFSVSALKMRAETRDKEDMSSSSFP